MKLILASDLSFLLKYGYKMTGIPKDKMKIGYVTTAAKGVRTPSFFENVKKTIKENGYVFDEIDIEEKTSDELREFFTDKNVIHIEGGNTFYLLRVIKETGFAELLKELIDEGKIYIGTSAGSYIMCPTIEVSDWDTTGKDRYGVVDFTALRYVTFVLKVHYTDEAETVVREKKRDLKYPLRILRDGQGIVVEDGEYAFVAGEEETVI